MEPEQIIEVKRAIRRDVERELWARAAGRCQFNDCNKLLYISPVTQERLSVAEDAHIYSFAKNGPRGQGPYKLDPKNINDTSNLLLVCHDCHKTIDYKNGSKYPADLLKKLKADHEKRICIVSGIPPSRKSHVVLYGANIGDEKSPLQYSCCAQAMFPNRFPTEEYPVELSMSSEHKDDKPGYWTAQVEHLNEAFNEHIKPVVKRSNPAHFSLFALAPQPLLILLGSLFTDKINVDVFQPHREPQSWSWQDHPDGFEFVINEPKSYEGQPALIISLSDRVAPERIESILGQDVSIWEITIRDCNNDFLKSQAQLSMFREAMRKLMVSIKEKHGQTTPLSIFPAMPVACAVELGRIRMPKAEMPWVIFDQNNKLKKFIKTINIPGGKNE